MFLDIPVGFALNVHKFKEKKQLEPHSTVVSQLQYLG